MIRAVVDTSVFIAGLLTRNEASSAAQVLRMWKAGGFMLVFSPQVLEELVAKLIDKGFSDAVIKALVKLIWEIGLRIPGAYEVTKLDKIDPKDNKFLAAALESGADYLVTLDKKHLLPLKHYHGTQIVTPALFAQALMDLPTEEIRGEEAEEKEVFESDGLADELSRFESDLRALRTSTGAMEAAEIDE